jgi:hypothetical protein
VEIHSFPDPAWVAIMEDASVAKARAELARKVADAQRRGEPLPSTEEQERMMEAMERALRPWPLDPVLALAVGFALVLGVFRGARRASASPLSAALPSWKEIGTVASALALVIGLIVVLRHLRPHE